MAAGDFYIRRNNGESDSITTANFDSTWDTEVFDKGGNVSYSSGTFTVSTAAPYLVLYSEYFSTTNTTNNERIEVQGEILVNGSAIEPGKAQDYIRKSSGHQECVVTGSAIVELTADDEIDIRFYRTDNSTTGSVVRVDGYGGVQILQLGDGDDFGIYSTTSSDTTTTTISSLTWDANDREDSTFTRSGALIDIGTAGRYLVCVGGDVSITGTGRTECYSELRLNGSTVAGTRSYCMLRGVDGCQDGALSGIYILDVSANEDLSFHVAHLGSTCTLGSGFSIQIWQIPSGGDECIAEATTGNFNTDGDFSWDTNPHIDTGVFTHSAGNANIDVDEIGNYLCVATFGKSLVDTVQRGYPIARISLDGATLPYASSGVYHRNSGGVGTRAGMTVAAIATNVPPDTSITIETAALAASGTMVCQSGQFALLSLESLYSYTYPPLISNAEDEQFNASETDVLVDGSRFESPQGGGTVELGDSSNYSSATKVAQVVNSWSDTQVDIDITLGALSEGALWFFVTNNSGETSPGYQVNIGRLQYSATVDALSPDHYWGLNNTFDDTGSVGGANMTTDSVGPPDFVTTPINRSSTHSLRFDAVTERRGAPDNAEMNITISHDRRTMGGWIQLGTVQKSMASLYKEGGGVNNACFLLGLGNTLIAQVADTSDFTVQAYSDFRLSVDRPYHIVWKFEANTQGNFIKLFVDGVEQSRSSGQPNATNFDAHSGDINWGDPDTNLEMGGSDVTFNGSEDCLYANWATWSASGQLADTEIFDSLFLDGAIPDDTLASGTESSMQTAMDAFASTTRPDWPVSFEIPANTGDTSFTLTLDDILFSDRITVQLVYRGSATLSVRNSGSSNLIASKVEAPDGGTVSIIETAQLQITVQDIDDQSALQNARVYVLADTGGPLPASTVLINELTNASGQVSAEIDFSANQPITGYVRSASGAQKYKTSPLQGIVISSGFSGTVFMIKD